LQAAKAGDTLLTALHGRLIWYLAREDDKAKGMPLLAAQCVEIGNASYHSRMLETTGKYEP
jgi:hypothetical protein